jgi:HPt (histidine-containing phosphotransfer) domain-containing protein
MDIEMPEIDGLEATRIIRSSNGAGFDPDIPIIAVTAHAHEADIMQFLLAGMNDCVTKPIKKKDILDALQRLIPSHSDPACRQPSSFDHEGENINVSGALERLGGDEDLLREIWRIFITDCPRNLGVLRQALESRNLRLSERQAHTLKSTAGNIGADHLKETALQMELASREKRPDKAWSIYEALEREAENVIHDLRELLSTSTART